MDPAVVPTRLRCALVLHVDEADCGVLSAGVRSSARYAPQFPTPHVERVSPGNLVALATAPDGADVVIWRWYDAVVLDLGDKVRLWEPAHGEVLAEPRRGDQGYQIGARAYVSAGLPDAEWWVCGPVVTDPGLAEVDLDEVGRLYTTHGLWGAALGTPG